MNKNQDEYFDKKYSESCKNLYTDYMIGVKKKKEEFISRGIITQGNVEKFYITYIEELFNHFIESIKEIIVKTGEEFETSLTSKYLVQFNEKNEKTICGHIDCIKQMIEKKLNRELSTSTYSNLDNIKSNITSKVYNIIIEENESIDRRIKREKKKNNNIIIKIRDSFMDNIVGYIVSFVFGCLAGINFDWLLNVVKNSFH